MSELALSFSIVNIRLHFILFKLDGEKAASLRRPAVYTKVPTKSFEP